MHTIESILDETTDDFAPAVRPTPARKVNRLPCDGRLIATENELNVLAAINNFGHLRRCDIARACWANSTDKSAKKMAYRTVTRMLQNGELLERTNTLGTRSLVLSHQGALRLKGYGHEAESGKDIANLSGQQFVHRMLGTSYLIAKQNQGADAVYGEHAFYRGRSVLTHQRLSTLYSKYPDGLVLYPGAVRGYRAELEAQAADWVEVEGAQKAETDYDKIIAIARACGGWLDAEDQSSKIVLSRVVFVYQEGTNEAAILNHLRKTLAKDTEPAARTALASIVLVRLKTYPGVVWYGQEEHTALSLLGLE